MTYEERERLLELGDLFLSERIRLNDSISRLSRGGFQPKLTIHMATHRAGSRFRDWTNHFVGKGFCREFGEKVVNSSDQSIFYRYFVRV
jgi:hypothetical protein